MDWDKFNRSVEGKEAQKRYRKSPEYKEYKKEYGKLRQKGIEIGASIPPSELTSERIKEYGRVGISLAAIFIGMTEPWRSKIWVKATQRLIQSHQSEFQQYLIEELDSISVEQALEVH